MLSEIDGSKTSNPEMSTDLKGVEPRGCLVTDPGLPAFRHLRAAHRLSIDFGHVSSFSSQLHSSRLHHRVMATRNPWDRGID